MHPAKSVILFTTASGAGYGILMLVAYLELIGAAPKASATVSPALALIVIGLLSSTLHLGHPERAWRAITQWRSSWLSREGVLAIWTFAPTLLYLGSATEVLPGGLSTVFATIMGLSALATVYCTAMIYASLKPIHAWATQLTPLAYIALSLATGGVILTAVTGETAALWSLTLAFLLAGLAVKTAYWLRLKTPAPSTPESATGLGKLGKVHLLEAPHTEENYLLREMGYQIARKHAEKLRRIAAVLGFVLPAILIAANYGLGLDFAALLWLALLSTAIGVLCERWLFFAEAKHTVALYYGAKSA